MPASRKPLYHIKAMSVPPDWNRPGEYETKSYHLPEKPEPTEWRCHRSAAHLEEPASASKIANFTALLHQYELKHRHPPDFWAAYNLPQDGATQPPGKLVIHQTISDRIPTLYIIPVKPSRPTRTFTTPDSYEGIKARA